MESGVLVSHLRKFKVVCGNNTADGVARNGLQEHTRAVKLVKGIGAFQNLVEDNQRVLPCRGPVCSRPAIVDKLLQAQQFGIEVADAAGQIVRGSHAAEQAERRNLQFLRKHGHACHGQNIVDAHRAEEGALACHVGAGDDIIVSVGNKEVVLHGSCAEEGVVNVTGFKRYLRAVRHYRPARLGVVIQQCGHGYVFIGAYDACYPAVEVHRRAPSGKPSQQEKVVEREAVDDEKAQNVAALVQSVQKPVELIEGPCFRWSDEPGQF